MQAMRMKRAAQALLLAALAACGGQAAAGGGGAAGQSPDGVCRLSPCLLAANDPPAVGEAQGQASALDHAPGHSLGHAAIAAAHPLATQAGLEALRAGGNAFDAAVAISAALAVVEPFASGLGGGGFWLLHRAADGMQIMVDGRETAPSQASAQVYRRLGRRSSLDGPLAAGIPGLPAALAHISGQYGCRPLKDNLRAAIRLARQGFPVTERYRKLAAYRLDALRAFPQSAALFLAGGEIPAPGHRIVQEDLAATLELLARQGGDAFYRGPFAARLVRGVRHAGGVWTLRDLYDYRVVERRPTVADYRGIRVVSAPLPSSGGIVLSLALRILEGLDLQGPPPRRSHLLVEAMRRAYWVRASFLGDADFVSVPVSELLAADYARELAANINPDAATPSDTLPAADGQQTGTQTTHFSVMDGQGNRVAATLSINLPFGSGFLVPGTGVVLNDEMDDFAIFPSEGNAYGLTGGQPNAIAPGKRPLSSMSPTFLEHGDRIALLGTPGGSRIISMVLLGTLDFAAGRGPDSWVRLPRFHHQFLPDAIQFEPEALNEVERAALRRLGHELQDVGRRYGNMQAILWDGGRREMHAASDPRGEGEAVVIEDAAAPCEAPPARAAPAP